MHKWPSSPDFLLSCISRWSAYAKPPFSDLTAFSHRIEISGAIQNLQQFHRLFVERLDLGEGSFIEKWKKQLEGAGDDCLQLAAELLYVQQFFTSITGPEKKIENVNAVLGWCSQPPSIPKWAIDGISRGLARDQSFNQHRPFHLAWLNEFLIHWQKLSKQEQEQLLKDPWAFADKVHSVTFSPGFFQPMQEAWLYVNFPDYFENISSRSYKEMIRDAFYGRLQKGPSNNVDADLFEIRKSLTPQFGEGFHFYRSPIVEQWQGVKLTKLDIELIRESLDREKYADFSPEEKAAYKHVHEVLRKIGEAALDELGGSRNYALKLTSRFHPNSGVSGENQKICGLGYIGRKTRSHS